MEQENGLHVLEIPEKLRIRTVVVHSDPETVLQLQEILRLDPDIEMLGSCDNGADAVTLIKATRPDLVFLDIHVSGMDGFSVLERLKGGPMPVVIFVTASERYALQAFEVSALDFLVEPIGAGRVQRAVAKAKTVLQPKEKNGNGSPVQRLAIRSGKKVFFLRPDEIDWIEAEGNSVRVHSGTESHILKMSISSLESQLDASRFVRIHRSTIVNVDKVRWLEPSLHGTHRVILDDGTPLVMSRKDKLAAMTGKVIKSRAE